MPAACVDAVSSDRKRSGNLKLFDCLRHSHFPVFIIETAFACKKQMLGFNVTLS